MAKKYDKERLIADWKTGGYSQRKLAIKYGLSPAMIAKLTKGIAKESEQLVSKIVDTKQSLAEKTDKEVWAISEQVEKRLQALKIDNFLDKGVGIAAKKAVEILQSENVEMEDIERFSKAQNNLRVGLGTQDKFSNSAQVNIKNTNAQQNNQPVVLKIGDNDIDSEKLGW